jgi:hypothetical protein
MPGAGDPTGSASRMWPWPGSAPTSMRCAEGSLEGGEGRPVQGAGARGWSKQVRQRRRVTVNFALWVCKLVCKRQVGCASNCWTDALPGSRVLLLVQHLQGTATQVFYLTACCAAPGLLFPADH